MNKLINSYLISIILLQSQIVLRRVIPSGDIRVQAFHVQYLLRISKYWGNVRNVNIILYLNMFYVVNRKIVWT